MGLNVQVQTLLGGSEAERKKKRFQKEDFSFRATRCQKKKKIPSGAACRDARRAKVETQEEETSSMVGGRSVTNLTHSQG